MMSTKRPRKRSQKRENIRESKLTRLMVLSLYVLTMPVGAFPDGANDGTAGLIMDCPPRLLTGAPTVNPAVAAAETDAPAGAAPEFEPTYARRAGSSNEDMTDCWHRDPSTYCALRQCLARESRVAVSSEK